MLTVALRVLRGGPPSTSSESHFSPSTQTLWVAGCRTPSPARCFLRVCSGFLGFFPGGPRCQNHIQGS